VRWLGRMGGGGLGVLRKEKGPRWAGLVREMEEA
jgi:hypothetical protein